MEELHMAAAAVVDIMAAAVVVTAVVAEVHLMH